MFVVETAKGRTYGECVMDEIQNIQMVSGRFTPTLKISNKPEPMRKPDALIYYTEKLRRVWNEINTN